MEGSVSRSQCVSCEVTLPQCLSQPSEAIMQSVAFMVLLLYMLEMSVAWTSLCSHS